MRRALTITLCGLGMAVAPATSAAADGGAVPAIQGGVGASVPGTGFNFIALGAGNGHTIVERVHRGTGVADPFRIIPGSWGVPGAAADGSTTGLSADGRTLVLAGYSRTYPPRQTKLAVLDTANLRVQARIVLRGNFVVDAISPDGRWLYFTHYKSPSAVDYEVVAYDLQQRQLIDKPIVDPREPDEKMQGQPVTRLMSPDGRWAYTLYSRVDGAPFIHALDTQGRTAACVDLPLRPPLEEAFNMRLRLGPGGALNVVSHGTPVVAVNTRTFAVSHLAQPATPKPSPRTSDGGSKFPWALMAIPAAAALAGLGVMARRRRRLRSAPA